MQEGMRTSALTGGCGGLNRMDARDRGEERAEKPTVLQDQLQPSLPTRKSLRSRQTQLVQTELVMFPSCISHKSSPVALGSPFMLLVERSRSPPLWITAVAESWPPRVQSLSSVRNIHIMTGRRISLKPGVLPHTTRRQIQTPLLGAQERDQSCGLSVVMRLGSHHMPRPPGWRVSLCSPVFSVGARLTPTSVMLLRVISYLRRSSSSSTFPAW
ncbi:uncharacterized protein [Vicugna pacos]|uniref:Uncharacterized protein n=1 Tax=Vicugna pacos TaxID=30538 RepID=A0ABM5CAM5_VICPA